MRNVSITLTFLSLSICAPVQAARKPPPEMTALRGIEARVALEHVTLRESGFSGRLFNALKNSGAETIGEAFLFRRVDIWRYPNVGRATLDEMDAFYARHGIEWTAPVLEDLPVDTRIELHRLGVRTLPDLFRDEPRLNVMRLEDYWIKQSLPRWQQQVGAPGLELDIERTLTSVATLLEHLGDALTVTGEAPIELRKQNQNVIARIRARLSSGRVRGAIQSSTPILLLEEQIAPSNSPTRGFVH